MEKQTPGTKREKKIRKVSKTRSTQIKTLSCETISNILSGKQTVESTLSFSDEVASAFTNMYLSEPVRYATVMYRVFDDLQGRMNLAYILSRHLLTRCATLRGPSEDINPNSAAPFSSVDVREILFPVLSDFIWKRKNKFLGHR
uniref:Wsv269-like protein n=1 Tax=Hemigrapsus takanoi nimavirus TaxID=2133792 RepID=A0A401IP10_9VIRU|nr:MAG: wsv269-like protein [Hemigrapsus takanoi nimavirus]GBG35345.1 wsv269-like protein [Hemigrapsus takanoi nimavirus]